MTMMTMMKKRIMLTLASILLFSGMTLADEQYSQADINKALEEVQTNTGLFDQTLKNIQENPQMLDDMVKEIQAHPELMDQLKTTGTNTELQNKALGALENNKDAANIVTTKLLNDPDFVKKVLVKMGQDTKYADELSKNPETRQELVNKVNNDPQFMNDVWALINEKKLKK